MPSGHFAGILADPGLRFNGFRAAFARDRPSAGRCRRRSGGLAGANLLRKRRSADTRSASGSRKLYVLTTPSLFHFRGRPNGSPDEAAPDRVGRQSGRGLSRCVGTERRRRYRLTRGWSREHGGARVQAHRRLGPTDGSSSYGLLPGHAQHRVGNVELRQIARSLRLVLKFIPASVGFPRYVVCLISFPQY